MQSEKIIARATSYWASHLGCTTDMLLAQPMHVITHGSDLTDYDGVFALFRAGKATVSFPPHRVGSLRDLLPPPPLTPGQFAGAFCKSSFTIIGPAYIGYADDVRPPSHPVRSLTEQDAAAVQALRANCAETEWEHGGSAIGEQPLSGVFIGERLVALAGYDVWGGTIAHISIITHPGFRGREFGRSAVAHLASIALAAGLVPQYRTLESNRSSIRIAEVLGFCHYATSVAVRINSA